MTAVPPVDKQAAGFGRAARIGSSALRSEHRRGPFESHWVGRRLLGLEARMELWQQQMDQAAVHRGGEGAVGAVGAVVEADEEARDVNARRTRAADAHEDISGWAADHRRRREAHVRALADAERWSTVAERCNGRTPPKVSKVSSRRLVLSVSLEEIRAFANPLFGSMTGGRYRLSTHRDRERHNVKSGLGLRVNDTHAGSEREVSTLSGGETFQASLSLALGAADLVTAQVGGVHLDALFVDERFGSLDSEALPLAMDELDRLREGGRTAGPISHISELRERICIGIEVRPTPSGSAISVGAVSRP